MGKKSRHYRANHGVKRRPMVTGLDNQLLLIARNGSVPIKNKLPPPKKKGLLVFVSYHFCFNRPPENPVIKQNSVPSESDSVRTPKKWNQKKKKKRKTRSCKENVDEARRFASNVDVRTEESSMAKKKTKQNKKKTKEKRRSAVPLYGGPLLDDDRCFPDGGGAFGRASLISCCPCSPPHLDIHHTFQ